MIREWILAGVAFGTKAFFAIFSLGLMLMFLVAIIAGVATILEERGDRKD